MNFREGQSESLSNILVLFIIIFFVEIFLAALLFSLIGLNPEQHKMTDMLEGFELYQVFLLAVVIAPVVEEFIFRYYINKPNFFLYGFNILMLVISCFYWWQGSLSHFQAGPLIVFFLVILYVLTAYPAVREQTICLYIESFPYVLYAGAAVFAFIHVFNFNDDISWYYTPVLVFPQFVIGLYLAYVRIRNGIWSSILVHAVNNLIPMTIIILAPENF